MESTEMPENQRQSGNELMPICYMTGRNRFRRRLDYRDYTWKLTFNHHLSNLGSSVKLHVQRDSDRGRERPRIISTSNNFMHYIYTLQLSCSHNRQWDHWSCWVVAIAINVRKIQIHQFSSSILMDLVCWVEWDIKLDWSQWMGYRGRYALSIQIQFGAWLDSVSQNKHNQLPPLIIEH